MTEKRATDHLEPAAKKRGNDRQITKDDESEEEQEEMPVGDFQRASEDVLKQRRILKARRPGEAKPPPNAAPAPTTDAAPSSTPAPTAPPASSNPFAGISLVASSQPAKDLKEEEAGKEEAQATKSPVDGTGDAASGTAAAKPSLFGALGTGSISGGFGSLAGSGSQTGVSFSFATASPSGPSLFGSSTTPIFSFSTGSSAPAPSALFGSAPVTSTGSSLGASNGGAEASLASLPEATPTTTGEEEETTVFSGEGALYEFDAGRQWRERGRGEMRVNAGEQGQGRVIMRQKGNLRLLLNANLWADMPVARMEGGRGVTFAVVNHAQEQGGAGAGEGKTGEAEAVGEKAAATETSEEEGANANGTAAADKSAPGLATFGFRIKSPEILEAFFEALQTHKGVQTGVEAAA